MKRVCKQCGASFELSESEIAFYKSKNLHLPKRCKECRQANKRGHAVQEEPDWNNVQKQSHDLPARNDHKAGKWVYALIAVSILLLFGLIRISNWYFSSNSARPPVTVENRNAGVEEEAGSQYTFRNAKLLNEHFEKHGKEMGFSSAEEYLAAANAVVNNASALHKTEKEDGDDVYYLEATNEFVIVSTDGFIRTYFYPNAGIDYYNRQ